MRGRRGYAALTALALLAAACGDDSDDGDSTAEGYRATIVRTEGGVPHITGDSLADVVFGQGYASGQDRACDLADQVLKVKGERALHLGAGDDDEHLFSDITWRAIGLYDQAVADWEDAGTEVTEMVTAYTAGWNAQLDDVSSDGLAGWCAGEDWVQALEPAEVYAYGRSVALLASSGNPALGGMLATAQPPDSADDTETDAGDTDADDAGDADSDEAALHNALDPITGLNPEHLASNGWAVGAERSAEGTGLLVGNPHFPWEGENRFWEVHLSIPGEMEAYGAQLSGLPGIGLGFNEHVAWTHTVSAGSRFTAYQLDLVDGDPTSYHYGDEIREMEPYDITVEVRDGDEVTDETRTLWRTHYGPVVDFPGLGWSEDTTLAFRDANLDNDALFDQYLDMARAEGLDDLIDAHRDHSGIPLFNTIAVDADGRAWYADTSATPNLSDDAIAAYEQALEDDPIVGIAAENQAVLLDGSDPANEWVEQDGARSPGLVPFEQMPQLERDDYVFNANDPFTIPHAEAWLDDEGYSPLHGRLDAGYSPRTRENLVILDDTGDDSPAGENGLFTLDSIAAAALQNTGFTARELRADVVERCEDAGAVSLPALESDDGSELLAATTVDVTDACQVLADWDGRYDLDRSGPALWRELLAPVSGAGLRDAGELWAEPYDPERPLDTPSGLVEAADGVDPVLQQLARAVQVLDEGGHSVDVAWGEVQFAPRAGENVPIHGGGNHDGVANIVGWGSMHSTLDPALQDVPERLVEGHELRDVDGRAGYPVNNGTSFLFAVELGENGPEGRIMLTYGNTEDRDDPLYQQATQDFSDKAWRTALLDPDDIEAAAVETVTVEG